MALDRSTARLAEQWDGDGIIARIETPELASFIRHFNVPVVDVRGSVPNSNLPLIDTDDQNVASLAASISWNEDFGILPFADLSEPIIPKSAAAGFWNAWQRRVLSATSTDPPGNSRDQQTIEYEKRGLLFQEDLSRWLASLKKPVGIMACNDIRGQQVMNICRRMDLMVPEETAIIGVDNDEVLCELSDPPLTSVAPDTFRIGYDAAVFSTR